MLSREMSRRVDEIAVNEIGIPSLILMENAGRSCAECLMNWPVADQHREQSVLVLCGPGNNGGDGFVLARHLAVAGWNVRVVLFKEVERYAGDPRVNLDVLCQLGIKVEQFDPDWSDTETRDQFAKVGGRSTDWIVDALLGTGARGILRPPIAKAIVAANLLPVNRLAIDLPTGLDCDSGEASEPTFRASVTCTMVEEKVGFQKADAHHFTGTVVVVGIGVPVDLEGLRADQQRDE
ncbi:MAG: NAD(P)H-hydrate epimerase [Mariniblastus sp.]